MPIYWVTFHNPEVSEEPRYYSIEAETFDAAVEAVKEGRGELVEEAEDEGAHPTSAYVNQDPDLK